MHLTADPLLPPMPARDPRHHVHRVVLPSGKTVEVVYFEEVAGAAPATTPAPGGLHVCACCASELVYPTAWEESGPHHWEVTRRCPNCEWQHTGIHEQELVEHFDDALDAGTEALVGDLERLMYANMACELDRFVSALELDLIVPDDF